MDGNSKPIADNVNHPAHYKSDSGLEAIDVIEAFTEKLSALVMCSSTHADGRTRTALRI